MGLCVLEIIVGKNTARDTAVKTVPRTKFWLNKLHNQAMKVFDCFKVCFYSGSDSIIVTCPCWAWGKCHGLSCVQLRSCSQDIASGRSGAASPGHLSCWSCRALTAAMGSQQGAARSLWIAPDPLPAGQQHHQRSTSRDRSEIFHLAQNALHQDQPWRDGEGLHRLLQCRLPLAFPASCAHWAKLWVSSHGGRTPSRDQHPWDVGCLFWTCSCRGAVSGWGYLWSSTQALSP